MVIVSLHTFTQLAASSLIDIPKQVATKSQSGNFIVIHMYVCCRALWKQEQINVCFEI